MRAPGGDPAAGGSDVPYVRPGDYRARDQLGRLVPRNPFADGIAMFRAIPGLAARFNRTVPESHLDADGVRCTCGAEVEQLPQSQITACPGECGRRFLRFSASRVMCALEPAEGQS